MAVAVKVAVAVGVAVTVAVLVGVAVAVTVAVAVEVAVLVAVAVGVAVAGGLTSGPVVKSNPYPLSHSAAPLTALSFPWNTISYLVLASRLPNGVRVALEPLQPMLPAILTCLNALSRNVLFLIESQSIGMLKFTLMLVLTGTLIASSAGFE